MKKKALIFGVTGQDGAYLSDFLIKKNYIVHGIKRRSSSFNTSRIDKIYNTHQKNGIFNLHYGDVTDSLNVQSLIQKISPDEIYNLAAQSHVKVSFETPEYTANADAIGVLRILESIKNSKKRIKFYQASTSEMYGSTPAPQSEKTVFAPVSPYGTSKLFSYWITRNYRDAYNLFACNGILFNHESPIRGETFVTRKITLAVAKYHVTGKCNLILGNINALRDWGDARDYVEGMWKMLQKKTPKDYVLATGKSYTVKKFIEEAGTILWNGPVGVFEETLFENGTKEIAKSIGKAKGSTIAGGGDTISAIEKFINIDDIDYISTGGGAFLEFLEGNKLPGIEIIKKLWQQLMITYIGKLKLLPH